MRALFTTQIGSGNWRPLAPFARVLEEAGHDVAFATTPIGCTIIAGHGFRCFPVGDDDWQAAGSRQERQARAAEPEQSVAVTFNQFIPGAGRRLPELLTLCQAWHPDVIVPEAIRTAVWAVLQNASYRANAARLRDEMAALPGPEYVMGLLGRLVAERRPPVA